MSSSFLLSNEIYTPMDEDFGEWYRRMLSENKLVDDRYSVKGMLVYRGNGMRIIKRMQRHIEDLLEADNHEPTLFPILIPDTLLQKEEDHIAGFADEVYWVTHAGSNPLERKLALRPTSETCMYPMFALWMRTYADLPIKVHQSVTVYRCETKQTRPLIRSREIYWNEGHTAFATRQEALENLETIKEIYLNLISGLLCIPVTVNQRPQWDKFPGAEYTIAFDALMPDGKTLQVATIHNLGQHFSKVFNLVFDDAQGIKQHAWQTSYGPGFGRLLAATIGVHGDEKGMIIPPHIAPIQAVIIPIVYKDMDREKVLLEAEKLCEKLKKQGIRVFIDVSDERPGAKYYRFEREGIPLRLELGPKDIKEGKVVAVRRDTGVKQFIPQKELDVTKILDEMQETLRDKARENLDKRVYGVKTPDEYSEKVGKGIVRAGWCGLDECAKKLEEQATILTIMDDKPATCIICGCQGKTLLCAKTY
jgi:prolyl-tRNA synthetase